MADDDSKSWRPTDRVIRGVVVKPYLPLKKHPELVNEHTHILNLYSGDELFVFEESKDGKWLRCYLRWIPLPDSYISGALLIDDRLVHLRNRIVIVPRKYVHLDLKRVVIDMPFLNMPKASDFRFATNDICKTPSLLETLASAGESESAIFWTSSKPSKPSFPYFRYQDRPLSDEIAPALVLLSSLIYEFYSSGDFGLFEQLVTSFYELNAIRMRLQFKLYTSHEVAKISKVASALLANVSKLVSSKKKPAPEVAPSTITPLDPSGVEGIFARNGDTGELLTYEKDSLQSLVSSTMFHGLSKNFPVSNYSSLRTDPPPNDPFEAAESHILVDVNDVKSDASVGNPMLHNLSASMYLCSRRGALTEPFTVNMDSEQITSLNNISAALFKNIPACRIERGNIYLAVILTDKIPCIVNSESTEHNSSGKSPFIHFDSKNTTELTLMRRGVAAGAVDITRIFSKYNESNADLSEAFKFKINLFGSFLSSEESAQEKSSTDMWHHESSGWGDLLERILRNSHKGVAVNPRATTLLVTVTEIKASSINKSAEATIGAIKSVPTFFYDALSTSTDSSERIYLLLGKVSLCSNLQTNIQAITIKVACANKQIKFNRIADEDLQSSWEFVTVRPGESIGETIRINGLKHMRGDEVMTVSAFLNGVLMARAFIYIKKGNKIMTYKTLTAFQLPNAAKEPLLNLELSTQYVGKDYNLEGTLERFKKLPSTNFDDNTDANAHCMSVLTNMTKVSVDQLQKYFRDLFLTYLSCFEKIECRSSEMFTSEVRNQLFVSFVDFIDKLIARSDRQRCLFKALYDEYLGSSKKLPSVGLILLQRMTAVIQDSSREWTAVGGAVSRTSLYLLMTSLMSSRCSKENWKRSFQSFFSEVCQFLASTNESVAKDQIVILQSYDVWLNIVGEIYEPDMLVQFSLGLLQSCQSREKNIALSTKELSPMEAKYLNTKLSLLRRIILHKNLQDYLFHPEKGETFRYAFISKCIDWVMITYTFNPLNISAARLANGVLISLIENAKDVKLARNLLRLVPTLCKAFLLTRKFCKENGHFKPKITFTSLFPFQIPSPILLMDSLIQSDVVVEVLLELITVICDLAKLGEMLYGLRISLVDVLSECANDIDFQTDFCLRQISNNHVITLYHIVKILAKGEFFPAHKWLGVCAMFDRSMTTLLAMYKNYMIDENLPHDYNKVDINLWAGYYKSIFILANNKQSYLIKLGIVARKGVYNITGNLKSKSATLLGDSWEAIASQVYDYESHITFGTGSVSPVQIQLLRENVQLLQELFLFAFHRHLDAVKMSFTIMWCCVVAMWYKDKSVQLFLDLCIPGLYNAYQSGRLYISDTDVQRFKICGLHTIHAPFPYYEPMQSFAEDISIFLHIICNAFKVSSQEEFDDDRTAVHMEMFAYLSKVNRPELFHQMIYNLFIHSLRRRDYVQAGLCLELLANTYEWKTNDFLPPLVSPPLPGQSSFERKEHLYKEAAKYFSKGLKLEKALSVYKDLIAAYDLINYDLTGLAYAYGEMSNIYSELQTVDRLIPTYFKVSFSGLGFPISIRNRVFIFEGLPFEHMTSMHDRLLRMYHGTTIVRSQEEIDGLFMNPPMGRFIHVLSVDPQFDISDNYKKNSDKKHLLNSKVMIYIKNRELHAFSNSVRLPGSACVTDLWVNEVTYITDSTFPTLMNRSEVVETVTRKLSPFQNAMRSLQVKIQEFNGLENMCWKVIKEGDTSSEAFSELSRNLAGTIDSPVNGGLAKYRAFLSPDLQPPLQKEDADSLKVVFSDLAIVLARCLIFHRELLPSKDLEKSHKMLMELFERNFEPEIKKNCINLEKITATTLTPISSQPNSLPHLSKICMLQNLLDSLSKPEASSSNQTESNNLKESPQSKGDTMDEVGIRSAFPNTLKPTVSATSTTTTYPGIPRSGPAKVPVRWALMGLDNKDIL